MTLQKWLPVLLLFFLATSVVAQSDNYLHYHQRFATVQSLIAEEEFAAAQDSWRELFEDYAIHFVKDLVIAAQVSAWNGNTKQTREWLRQAMQKGAPLDCLKRIEFLAKKVAVADWEILANHEKEYHKIYLSSIEDLALFERFHRNYALEQEEKSGFRDSEVISNNLDFISREIKESAFPGVRRIGLDDRRFAPKISSCNLDNSKVIVTLLHTDHPIHAIGWEKLTKAIEEGHLHPRQFVYLYIADRYHEFGGDCQQAYCTKKLPDYHFNFPFEPKSTDIERVDADRATFGIISVKTQRQLKAMEIKYGMKFDFGY